MAPPAKITFVNNEQDEIRALEEEREPDVLPADFGEWDSGPPPATLPDNFEDFDTAPRAPAPVAESVLPEPSASREQVSAYADFEEPSEPVQSKREKAAAEARRKAEAEARAQAKAEAEARKEAEAEARAEAKAQAEARKRAEAEARAEAKAEAEARRQAEAEARAEARKQARAEARAEEEEEEGKGRAKGIFIAIAAALLVAVGGFYVFNLHKPAPSPAVTEQTVAHPAESIPLTQTTKPKPGPATPTTPAVTETQTEANTEEASAAPAQPTAMQEQLNAAPRIAGNIRTAPDTSAPPPTSGINMDMGNPGAGTNVFGSKPGPNVAVATPKTINVAASIMAGRAISKPSPIYPPFARTARVEGTVVLHASISKAGTIQNVSVISGPPMLRQAALDAVKTWRYKPYLLDNEPVEVETTVDVIFVLSR